jgi:hypothetical protein
MSTQDKVAIKLGEQFDANVALINTLVWGRPDYLAEVEGGVLKLHNLHVTRHGNGILAKGGTVEAHNLNFLSKKGYHTQEYGGDVILESVITQGELSIDGSNATKLSIER